MPPLNATRREELAIVTLTWQEDQLFFFYNHPLIAPTSKVPVFLKRGEKLERGAGWQLKGGPRRCRHRQYCLPPSESGWKSKGSSGVGSTHEVGSDDGQFNQSGRCCKTVLFCMLNVASHPAGCQGLIHGNSWRGGGDGGRGSGGV